MGSWITAADSYTISSDGFAPESAKQYSCYNFVNRYSPAKPYPDVASDSRMVLYGIRHFVENYMTQRVTVQDVQEASLFMERSHSFGGGLYFPKDLWMRVVNECGGYLPLTIKSLPDGSVFFPNEPVIQVEARDGFGELAAHIESRLVGCVSRATATATLCRHWFNKLVEEVKKDYRLLNKKFSDIEEIEGNARFQVHNFGDRACMTGEESVLSSMAHLLSFNGTDSICGAVEAWKQGAENPIGSSILATAHRNIIAWDTEYKAFQAIAEREHMSRKDRFKIVACVSDAYDFNTGYRRVADLAMANPDITFVCRPDSGSGLEQILDVCEMCKNEPKLHSKHGEYYLPTNMRIIYGDSVNPKKQFKIYEAMRDNGFPATFWMICGVGGYIVNNSLRDSLSSSYKLCETFTGPKIKLSNTPSKMSIPYYTKINPGFTLPRVSLYGDDTKITVYDRGFINRSYYGYNFADARAICDGEFDLFGGVKRDFGLDRETLSDEIRQYQDDFAISQNRP